MNSVTPHIAAERSDPEASRVADALGRHGYHVIHEAIAPSLVAALAEDLAPWFEATPRSVGPFYGPNTRRFHGLLRRSPHMAAFVMAPVVLGAVQAILGPHCDLVQLNLTQAIEILPGGDPQPPHRDQDMWPLHVPGVEYLVNVMWPLGPYSAENGATMVWPDSHLRQDEIVLPPEEAIAIAMEPGAALLFLGSTLHAGGANRTATPRRGMIVSYSLGGLKPYELPWLAYPPEIARGFSPELAALAGYRAHRPNLGTFEGRCPSSMLSPDMSVALGAVDSLRPEQEELIALYRSGALDFPSASAMADR
ncbi:phytanoyl-CoA dioxygenase family protein [Flavisphingomonas formosensis]|uniref:phytanoyl-CoA dioxygenase family protein n=1 Tax=Flavisphingomonas formosensis TaxID=861534 RepID=UPI0012F93830|nr:phytanoyl-CoA dioxygenase family protein [Sphingomonas formosensis]